MITKLYDAPGSLINKIFNITRNKKFRNLTADEMFTRNIPLARVVMFRNNVQSRSQRGTLKVLDPSPRNYVTARYFVRLHVWTHALRTHTNARVVEACPCLHDVSCISVQPSNLIFKRGNLFMRKVSAEKFSHWYS